MRMILKGRGEGKTTELVKLSAETGYPIVVGCKYHTDEIKNIAIKLGVKIPKPISIHKDVRGVRLEKVLIDHTEILLCYLVSKALGNSVDIHAITLNADERPLYDAKPVKHGKWVCTNSGHACSECSKNPTDNLDADIWSAFKPPHCPNCGVKMKDD